MTFSGIDLHSHNSVVVVSDEEDRIVSQKRLPDDLDDRFEAKCNVTTMGRLWP